MKLMLLLVIGFASANAISQTKVTAEAVSLSLSQSGNNRMEIEKVLKHYSKKPSDSLKLKAAHYLIDGLKWHKGLNANYKIDPAFKRIILIADSMYYKVFKEHKFSLNGSEAKKKIEAIKMYIADTLQKSSFAEPELLGNPEDADTKNARAAFLIDQIDHAFYLREYSPLIKQLPFKDFCDYILPYKMIDGIPLNATGKEFFSVFGKYIGLPVKDSIPVCVERYNKALGNLRFILGEYPFDTRVGYEDLFFNNKAYDCFDIAQLGYIVLNACGIPVDLEYNISYKIFQGKHSQCNVHPILGNWTNFSPESAIPKQKESKYQEFKGLDLMNLYLSISLRKKNRHTF